MYLNIIPKCSDLFSGREKELKKLGELFRETNFFYIEGISGVGKTSLMLKWANILIKKAEYKDRILWMKCFEDWTLDNIFMEIDEWLVSMGEQSIKEYPVETFKSEEKALYIINQLNKKDYILFIDDFQNIKQESSRLFIDIFKNHIRDSHIYVITHKSLSINPVESVDICRIKVKELEYKDSLLFLKKIFAFHDIKKNPEIEILEKIIDKTQGHPFFLKTFLGIIISKVSTIEEILEKSDVEKDTGKIIFEKIMNNLLPEENMVLEILSASRIALKPDMIKEVCDIENLAQVLSLLEAKILIEKEETCSYLIHPLLKSYIWNSISESKKRIIHNKLGKYFEKKEKFFRESFYHNINGDSPKKAGEVFANVMEKLYCQGYYEEILKKLGLLEKHISLTEYMKIVKSKTFLIQGNWEEGLAILEELKGETTDENLLAEIYYYLAKLYRHTSNINSAIGFCEDSLKIFRKAGNLEKIIKVINELIANYSITGELEKVSELIDESFAITEKENNEIGMAFALKRKAVFFLDGEEYEGALKVTEKLLMLARKIDSFQLICNALHIKGIILSRIKKYDEACKCFNINLDFGEKTGNKFIITRAYRGLCRVFYEKGDLEKAQEFIKESIENALSAGNKLDIAISESDLAGILEEKGEIDKAIDLYTELLKKGEELSLKKLEIGATIQIIKNRIKTREQNPTLEDILKLKKKIPEYLTRERIEINLILADIYIRKYKQKKKEILLNEALELSEKSHDRYCLSKTCYMISKIPHRNEKEKEIMRKRAEDYFKKLTIRYEKRELKEFFEEIDKNTKDMYFIKTPDKEIIVDYFELEKVRKKKEKYELFIDVPGKYAFEKEKGEIDIFRKSKIFSLLLFLIHNKDEKSSLEDIHKEICEWEYEGDRSDNEIRKNISRLRKLIEPNEKNFKYIFIREGFLTQKTKYYFNYKANFCLINCLYDF